METMCSSTHIDPALVASLGRVAESNDLRKDAYGNEYLWSRLRVPADLPKAAVILRDNKARLCTITALNHDISATEPALCLEYHFDVRGAVITLITELDPSDNTVPTITHLFLNADWPERESAELYDLHVAGNTNPERLFLDDSIDQGILNDVIPLSIMMNGACTTDMWEHITAMNLGMAPHSVFPKPEGPAESWPPLVPHETPVHGSPLPDLTDEQLHIAEKISKIETTSATATTVSTEEGQA